MNEAFKFCKLSEQASGIGRGKKTAADPRYQTQQATLTSEHVEPHAHLCLKWPLVVGVGMTWR